jgi:hypothetical protein
VVEDLLGIKVQRHPDGPQFGYFWCNAITPDWCGPEGTRDDALRAATVNLLYFAKVGSAFDGGGAAEAQNLLRGR